MSVTEATLLSIVIGLAAGVTMWLFTSIDAIRMGRRDAQEERHRKDPKNNQGLTAPGLPFRLNWVFGLVTVGLLILWLWIMDVAWSSNGPNLHPVWRLFGLTVVVGVIVFMVIFLMEKGLRQSARTHRHGHYHYSDPRKH